MAAILQKTFSNNFSWMKIAAFWIKFTWNLFLRVQMVWAMAWCQTGNYPLPEPMLTNLYDIEGQALGHNELKNNT